MLTLGQQKIDAFALGVLGAAVVGVTVVSLVVPDLMPWSFLAPAAIALVFCWALRWEITAWAWLWVFSHGLLDWPSWRIEMTGFFNMTVPRVIFLAAALVFLLHFLIRRWRLRFDRKVLWVMLVMLVYCAISAALSGWRARTYDVATAPYYRFIGSLLFPFVMFFLVYNATYREKQINWALAAICAYGWYALYISYLQYAANMGLSGARRWIWPAYINDPNFGIHFDRARGAFAGAPPQAFLLVLLFYADLFLIRKTQGHAVLRALSVVQAVLTPPAIFFTGLRSGYLAFGVCGVVWCLVAVRKRLGAAKLTFAALAAFVAAAVFWNNITQTDRLTGGMAQRSPIVSRMILLEQSWEIIAQHPLTGVGFGHFVDAQQQLQRDPGSLSGMSYGALVEHNLFLNMLAETGVVGLVGTIAIFILLFLESVQLYRRLPPSTSGMLSRLFVVLFWTALANYLTDATFRDPLWDVFSNGLFWSLAGLVVGYNRLLEPHSLDLPRGVPAGAA